MENIKEIYDRAANVLALLADLPVNEQEFVLYYALRLAEHDALMKELETHQD
ncbi:unnamed protein product [marine sediment metagenome]|uniref:Uncharacterized protein n=1 Tax=marine sediment metagenome TaxID=412755 RepID=X1P084_9ZZZZ